METSCGGIRLVAKPSGENPEELLEILFVRFVNFFDLIMNFILDR